MLKGTPARKSGSGSEVTTSGGVCPRSGLGQRCTTGFSRQSGRAPDARTSPSSSVCSATAPIGSASPRTATTGSAPPWRRSTKSWATLDGDSNSKASHGGRRPVQLQPFGCQRTERSLVVVPGPDDLVHSLHPDAEQGADEVLLAPALLQPARQPAGLAVRGNGQEAVPPAVPGRLEAARHALGSQRLEGSRQQRFLNRIHGT